MQKIKDKIILLKLCFLFTYQVCCTLFLELPASNNSPSKQVIGETSSKAPNTQKSTSTKAPKKGYRRKKKLVKATKHKPYLSHEEIEVVDSVRNSTVHRFEDTHNHNGN